MLILAHLIIKWYGRTLNSEIAIKVGMEDMGQFLWDSAIFKYVI